jgi:hypothetical protein
LVTLWTDLWYCWGVASFFSCESSVRSIICEVHGSTNTVLVQSSFLKDKRSLFQVGTISEDFNIFRKKI